MRLFIAVGIDDNTKDQLYNNAKEALEGKGNITLRDNFHITLKFLGETEPQRLEAIKKAMDSAAKGLLPFSVLTGHYGAFKSYNDYTVFINIQNSKSLCTVFERIDSELEKTAGFEKERRAFKAHITAARRFSGSLQEIKVIDTEFDIAVNSIILFESVRENGKLIYKEIYKTKLNKA